MTLTRRIESRDVNALRGEAAGAISRGQLARLFKLVLILQAERFPNAGELAESCEVSRRTIYRDLEVLTEAGVPVRFRAERQGYQLSRGFFLPPTTLDPSEALALLILAQRRKGGDGFEFARLARDGAAKLVQSIAPEARELVLNAAGASCEESTADALPRLDKPRRDVYEAIRDGLARRRQVRVWYRETPSADESCTKVGVYRLVEHDGRWFVVGRSSLHRRIETIEIATIARVVATDDPYEIPPRFRLDRHFGQAWGVRREPLRHAVHLRFAADVAHEHRDRVWHSTQKRVPLPDGRVDLHFVVDGLEEVLRWVLGFGSHVEVLGPAELRDRVFRSAVQTAKRHRPGRRFRMEVDSSGSPIRMATVDCE